MRSTRNLKAFLALLLILSIPSVALPNPGKYINLEKGQVVPWKAWCFDEVAAANIVTDKEFSQKKCELKIKKEKELQKAEFNLEIGKLQAEMDYEISTRQAAIESLKKENLKLEQVIIDNSNPDWVQTLVIGALVGSLTTAVLFGVLM